MDRGRRVVATDLRGVVSVDRRVVGVYRRVVSIHRSRVIVSILRLVRLISTPDVLRWLVRLVSTPGVRGASWVVSMMWWRTPGADREESVGKIE